MPLLLSRPSVLFALAAAAIVLATPGVGGKVLQPGQTPCQRPQFTRLAPLAGTWRVAAEDRMGGPDFVRTEATAEIRTAAGGCSLLEVYRGTRDGVPLEVLGIFTVTSQGTLQQLRLDSGFGLMLVSDGRPAGDTLVFDVTVDAGGRVVRMRQRYFDLAPSGFRVERLLSWDAQAPWEIVYRGRYQRAP